MLYMYLLIYHKIYLKGSMGLEYLPTCTIKSINLSEHVGKYSSPMESLGTIP